MVARISLIDDDPSFPDVERAVRGARTTRRPPTLRGGEPTWAEGQTMIGNQGAYRCHRNGRAIASLLVAALVTVAAPRAEARPYQVNVKAVGDSAARDVGEELAIGFGITTGVLALVGGAIWYALHRRNETAEPAPADMAPPAPAVE